MELHKLAALCMLHDAIQHRKVQFEMRFSRMSLEMNFLISNFALRKLNGVLEKLLFLSSIAHSHYTTVE